MSTDSGHFTTGHGVQFYLQYLLSDREQYTACQFQRPALRVPSLKEMCTPQEELESLLARSLSSSLTHSLSLSPLSTKQKLIQNQHLCKIHRFRGEGTGKAGGQMWAARKTTSSIDWLRIWFKGSSP